MALTMKEIAEIQCFKIGVCYTNTPCSVYQEENLIRGLLCHLEGQYLRLHAYHLTSIRFHAFLQIAYLLRTLVLPKTPNILCLCNLFIKYRLLKQEILLFCVVFRLSHLSISLSDDVRCQDMEKT